MWLKWFSISLRLVIIIIMVNSIHSGVPGLTKLLRGKFPRAFLPSSQFIKRTEIDHLCIDMNYLLHKCNRVSDNSQFSISYRVLMRFLDSLLITFKPTKSVIFAFDGPASFAKMITQRYRRINEDSSKDYLTPGTDYMNTIEDFMNFYIITKIANKKNLQFPHNITFFLSTPNEQGEGEFKIFDWIHNINHKASKPITNTISILNSTTSHNLTSNSTISPKESILICGGDADLIIQSLLCRQPNDIYFYPMDVSVICNITSLRSLSLFETGESILPKKSQFIQQSNELLKVSNHSIQYSIRYPQITSEHQQYDLALFYLFLGNDYVPRLHGSTRQNLLIAYSKLINQLYLEANQTRDVQPPFLLTIPSIHSQSSNTSFNQSISPLISFNFTRLKDLFELYTSHLISLARRPRSYQKLPEETFSTSAISLLFHLTKNRQITKYEWFQLQYPIFKTPSSSLSPSSSLTSFPTASSASSATPSKRYFLSFLSFPEKKSFIIIPYSSHSYVNSRRFSSYYLLSHMNHKLYQNLITMEHKGKNNSEIVISHDKYINELNQFIPFSTNFLNSTLPYVYYAVVPKQSSQRKTPVVYRNKAYVPVVKWNYHWNHSDAKVITSLVHSFSQHLDEISNRNLPRNISTNIFATSKYSKLLSHCQQNNISFVLKMRYSELAQTNLSPPLYEYIHTNISHSILKPFLLIDDYSNSKSPQSNSVVWYNSSDMLLPIMNITYHNYEIFLNNTYISVPAYYYVNDTLGREMISDWILRTYFPYLMTNESNEQIASSSYQTYLQIENKLLEKQLLHITLPIDDFERCSDEQTLENDRDNESNENEGQNDVEVEEERVIETTEPDDIDSDVNLSENDHELMASEEDKFNPLLLLQPNSMLKDIANNNHTHKPTDLTSEDKNNLLPYHNDYYDTLFNVTSKQLSFEFRDASNQFRTITEHDIVVYLKGLLWIYYIYYHGLCSDQSFCYSNYHAPTTGEIHRYLHNKHEEFLYLQQTNSTNYRSFDEMMKNIIYLPYSTVKPLSPENVCISLIPPKNPQSVPIRLKKIWEGFNNRSHTELDLDCNLEKEYINNTITFNDKRPNFFRLIEKLKELRNQNDSNIFADDHSWVVYSPLHKYSSYYGHHKTLKPLVHIHLPAMKLNSLFKIPKYYRRLRWLSTPIRPYHIPTNQTNTLSINLDNE